MTSVGFPHANQKAEKSVGSAKRVIRDSVKPNGELDPIPFLHGFLTLRNTPDQDTGMTQQKYSWAVTCVTSCQEEAKSTSDTPHRVERYLARGG